MSLFCDKFFLGWELFDPFVPVEVPAFSPGELDVMIDYLVEKKWVDICDDGILETDYVSISLKY